METLAKQPGQSHSNFSRARKLIELEWIKKLQTVYPLGLNDNIMGIGNVSRTDNINILDIVSKNKRSKRSHGRRVNRNKKKSKSHNINVSDLLKISKNNGTHQLLTKLCSLPVTKLNNILNECDRISLLSSNGETVRIIMAFCYSKLFPKIDRPESHKRRFIKIEYISKGIDLVNVANILNDKRVTKHIPGYFDNKELPIICYLYKEPSRRYVFNYSKISKDIDVNTSTPAS